MEFSTPMIKGTLVKRYKRFLADISLENGELITAHCPNTGSMKTCGDPGDQVILSYNPDPKRKLAYSWEYTQTTGGFIGINTHRPNQVVFEALTQKKIPEFTAYDVIRKEVKYGEKSRIDFLLSDSKGLLPDCYIEVKNVTLLIDGKAQFPDAVTSRGFKHLEELEAMKHLGFRSVLLFFVNRPNMSSCEIAKDLDPKYYKQLGIAMKAGVEILAYQANACLKKIQIGSKVPFYYH